MIEQPFDTNVLVLPVVLVQSLCAMTRNGAKWFFQIAATNYARAKCLPCPMFKSSEEWNEKYLVYDTRMSYA